MKAEIREVEKGRVYPLLMKNIETGEVVLFTSDQKGVILLATEAGGRPIGFNTPTWVMSFFKPFQGELVLSND